MLFILALFSGFSIVFVGQRERFDQRGAGRERKIRRNAESGGIRQYFIDSIVQVYAFFSFYRWLRDGRNERGFEMFRFGRSVLRLLRAKRDGGMGRVIIESLMNAQLTSAVPPLAALAVSICPQVTLWILLRGDTAVSPTRFLLNADRRPPPTARAHVLLCCWLPPPPDVPFRFER